MHFTQNTGFKFSGNSDIQLRRNEYIRNTLDHASDKVTSVENKKTHQYGGFNGNNLPVQSNFSWKFRLLQESYSQMDINEIDIDLMARRLTLNVRWPSYLGLTRSISWLLMPWLLTSPGHQQPWYWLCRIGRFLSYLRKDFNYLRRTNVEKWHKM